MRKKKLIATVIAASLASAIAVGGISAYFTDADTKTNDFTIGKVELDLQEPNWNPTNATKLVPLDEVAKNPLVKNIGVNPEYVFMTVRVPVFGSKTLIDPADGLPVDDTGAKITIPTGQTASDVRGQTSGEYFKYGLTSGSTTTYYNSLLDAATANTSFTVLDIRSINPSTGVKTGVGRTEANRQTAITNSLGANGYGEIEYVIAYIKTANNTSNPTRRTSLQTLAANASTPALFNKVQLKNFREDESLELQGTANGNVNPLDMEINAYAIQTTNIPTSGTNTNPNVASGENGNLTSSNAASALAIFNIAERQDPVKTDKATKENANTDVYTP